MTTVAVTGANGKTGRAVVADLLEHDLDVLAVDVLPAPGERGTMANGAAPLLLADLTDYGQAVDALRNVDAVIHLANIPAPDLFPSAHTMNTNATMNHNAVSYTHLTLPTNREV